MKNHVFSIYDSKAEIYHNPMFFKAIPEAIRAFSDEANRKESAIAKHPEDYTLFKIGEFDIERGLLIPANTPQALGVAIEFQQAKDTRQIDLVDATKQA